ncbi:MAG: peptidoglycan DD-metalloendopeptidase family protein [Anaerolineae bacterium]
MRQSSGYSPDWRGTLLTHAPARLAALVWRWSDDHVGQRPALGRLTAHAGLILTLACLILLGGLGLDSLSAVVRTADKTFLDAFVQNVDAASSALVISERPYYRGASQARITRLAEAHTAIPERPRLEIITYTVQAGDTTEKIAERFDLQPTTLLWSNPELEKMPDLLMIGQALTILPLDGVYHTVGVSDTLESLAKSYKVDVEAISSCPFNEIPEDGELATGAKLIVPGGTKPYEARQVTAYTGPVPVDVESSGTFRWPTVGTLTQGYWYGHRAIDIGASVGTAIRASDGGFVSFAGWTDIGYGYLVVVDHDKGFQTYYAHLSNIFVQEGQPVNVNEVLGAMGSTGNSTGPHLHFEIRYDGYPTNPLIYLP